MAKRPYFSVGLSEEFYGWTNRETWVCKLWMDNDETSQTHWAEMAAQELARLPLDSRVSSRWHSARQSLAEILRDTHDVIADDYISALPGVLTDLLGTALSAVDWSEIAEALLEDAREGNASYPEVQAV